MKEIDCRGLSYLKIIREIKKYFNSIGEGEAVVIVNSELGRSNVLRYAAHKGYQVDEEDEENRFAIKIEKRGCLEVEDEGEIFSILVTREKLGDGEDELGITLINEYFEALNEYDKLPKEILFLNSGVKLFSKDSKAIEDIKMLYKKGVKLLINDTSLDYYNLTGEITFGEIASMYDMVVAMKKAKKLIKL
ncbi:MULTISPECIES: sulfurtransferase-like selenium metabolism protein YedF [unclassified Clostridium]|uniref:sulfurtransferase-like selenium metabolism protein YedF n=1 Tax=unclassified Clostridium TaxID=2614128 RepID=UPI00029868C9|nr:MULTISPECIES: sulfurtransferase-like selenium metabolism protein YedF [unclassified Clostridium]EKQ50877.1 MAG: selenium metabolism protein YedF [Clostridium sp. Maddingley MBC34-26]